MKKVNLTPKMVAAIQNMQESAENLVVLIDQATDYIVDCTDIEDKNAAVKAFEQVKSMRYLRNQIAEFIDPDTEV